MKLYKKDSRRKDHKNKARHFSGTTLCLVGIGVPNKTLGWFPQGFVEDKLLEFSLIKV